ncbi:NAD-dependent deacetylase CobB [Thermoclostridium stercorarium subsp. stercorarium DSM 8532]|jgi:NAD-dependent deacetylase|uniref:NAD-dependent protein deacetylase n=4 Tax=Thermoclostridium stercorarium TaxID=1510 RepID=L7VJA7_THES1|nr:NAD-dependent protein deacylase [Thermoclostridium stercorarium]AGC68135.1 NAD-dependent deacetylase CobB [Thermoclostridium stercorarium subsp. stercorarium DSM 8532]AGI39161.1 deacetylase [Thermoclostridium stercorarium subsp. stercorarium DSM 8532]ANW98512.1 NAD-dependent protein deacylase [Thermoclostridium stercorarium subsp. thermolacticum DSM 2910]ANX01047.1 NAD-dependent protein deacylase [Thermoclostridium stercorarium subsp. leptospartum DSM 9219]UZQ86662.1 NAD-dependent protein d
MNMVEEAVKLIRESESIVVLTGAGASTESGIPDFRSNVGPPKKKKYDYPVEVLLSHTFFINNTEIFYDYYMNNMVYRDAKPNDCHKALAEMEKYCNVLAVITQNIDGLHQDAGSSDVIELHGSTRRNYCMKCGKAFSLDELFAMSRPVPKCDECGGIIKPDVVLYEEPLNEKDLTRAMKLTVKADAMLVIGTSLVVYPAAGLLNYYRGDKLIIINMDPTPFDYRARLVIHDSAGKVMRQIVDGLKP